MTKTPKKESFAITAKLLLGVGEAMGCAERGDKRGTVQSFCDLLVTLADLVDCDPAAAAEFLRAMPAGIAKHMPAPESEVRR